MNSDFEKTSESAVQDDRYPTRIHCLFSAVIFLFSALLLPLSLTLAAFELPAIVMIGLMISYVSVLSRRKRNIIPAVLLLLLGIFFGGAEGGALLLSVPVGVAAGAHLTRTAKSPLWALLISVAVFGGFLAFGQDVSGIPLLAFFHLPGALLLALAVRQGERRTVTVLAVQAGWVLFFFGTIAVLFYRSFGSIGRETVLSVMEELRTELASAVMAAKNQMLADAALTDEMRKTLSETFTDASVRSMILQLTVLLPGVLVAGFGVLAFLAQSLFLSLSERVGDDYGSNPVNRLFILGIPSCVVYLTAVILSLFSSESSMVFAVAQNFSIILFPAFCFSGIQHTALTAAALPQGKRFAALVIPVVLFVISPEAFAVFTAFDGIFVPIRLKLLLNRSSGDKKD